MAKLKYLRIFETALHNTAIGKSPFPHLSLTHHINRNSTAYTHGQETKMAEENGL